MQPLYMLLHLVLTCKPNTGWGCVWEWTAAVPAGCGKYHQGRRVNLHDSSRSKHKSEKKQADLEINLHTDMQSTDYNFKTSGAKNYLVTIIFFWTHSK